MQNLTYTVSQLTYTIKNLLENQIGFQGFVLKGEISNFTKHRTGHLYFALKDESAQIRAVMFSSHASNMNFTPKDGDKVTVTGSISLYAPQGSYSVQVNKMQLDGAGELYIKYLEMKENLKKIGWFDKPKRKIPKYPKKIGVITSPTGAVIQDITNTVNRRYRLTEIILYPALVQGTGAALSIANQINRANEENICDVLIVGRGGGSIEDLWGFNELQTITAIYQSKIPVITAIGHETDDTISDLVSDLRAPTPTAAAELATPDSLELIKNIFEIESNMLFKVKSLIANNQNTLMHLIKRLDASGPESKLSNYQEKLNQQDLLLKNYYSQTLKNKFNVLKDNMFKLKAVSPEVKLNNDKTLINQYEQSLKLSFSHYLENEQNSLTLSTNLLKSLTPLTKINNYVENVNKIQVNLNKNFNYKLQTSSLYFEKLVSNLESVSPLTIMKRGFAMIKDEDNLVITSVKDINLNQMIEVNLVDGLIKAQVKEKKEQ